MDSAAELDAETTSSSVFALPTTLQIRLSHVLDTITEAAKLFRMRFFKPEVNGNSSVIDATADVMIRHILSVTDSPAMSGLKLLSVDGAKWYIHCPGGLLGWLDSLLLSLGCCMAVCFACYIQELHLSSGNEAGGSSGADSRPDYMNSMDAGAILAAQSTDAVELFEAEARRIKKAVADGESPAQSGPPLSVPQETRY
jgi:hypothetical protein